MSTIRQKKAADILAHYLQEGGRVSAGKVLREAGYSKSIALKPASVLNSKGFKAHLASYDDTLITDRWYNWAVNGADKRVAMAAGKNIITLKDRWPKHGPKVVGLFQNIQQLSTPPFNGENRGIQDI